MREVLSWHPGGFPACFSSLQQYRNWKASAKRVRPGDSHYCTDCTPQFQSDMIRQRRCGYPGTTFHVDVDGFFGWRAPGLSSSQL